MIFLITLGLICFVIITMYNKLVRARLRTGEAWSTVDTQLKRRYDLIPNLVEVVKGYAKHESQTLERVIQARNMAMASSENSSQKMENENILSGTLKSIFALSENYPDLKANANFVELQREITDTEDKIQATRQFYNTTVLAYNTMLQVFPSNILANLFSFKEASFFKLDEDEMEKAKNPVPVQL